MTPPTIESTETRQEPAQGHSLLTSDLPIGAKLDRARLELLDLSARNRLLNVSRARSSTRALEIVDERSTEIHRLLVTESRVFSFVPGRAAKGTDDASDGEGGLGEAESNGPDEIAELEQPEADELDDRGIARRHMDTRLQTRLTSEGLQKRLLNLYYEARTLEEEQGVNILFLALGMLKWIDPSNRENVRYAPLILVPVELERGNAGERFRLKWRGEDLAANLSLEAYLNRVHKLKLPSFNEGDDFDPEAYLGGVAESVATKDGWEVLPDEIVLGFFSFAKFLMYRDLDPEVWPPSDAIVEQPLIRSLLGTGFEAPLELIPEELSIDSFLTPADMLHIMDSDASQTVAIHEVRSGRNLVIQGPPGTGKSQTIANVIASAVRDGKSVLFVAEKMAALEVVKRRLDHSGVGDMCLELHSNKANKRVLLEELRRTWELGAPKSELVSTLDARILAVRDRLNAHSERMHTPLGVAELTHYQVVGQLTRLRANGERPSDIRFQSPEAWSAHELRRRERLLEELAERVEEIQKPIEHPWCGVGLEVILPIDVERLMARVRDLHARLEAIREDHVLLSKRLERPVPQTLAALTPVAELAKRVAGAPHLSAAAMAAPEWESHAGEIAAAVAAGEEHARLMEKLAPFVSPEGWTLEPRAARELLATLPAEFSLQDFGQLESLSRLLPELLSHGQRLARAIGRPAPTSIVEIERAITIGERVSKAPNASPDAFLSDLWENGVERAGELAEAVATRTDARRTIEGKLVEDAWTTDLSGARATLAAHGTSFFRFFNGEWRRSRQRVRSLLVGGDLALDQVLPLLDALGRGQKAEQKITNEDEFGRSSFGSDWQGIRSNPAPLQALVEWMRSLRGLGAEPRLIAGQAPDRPGLSLQSERTAKLLDDVRTLLRGLWEGLGGDRDFLLGEALGVDRVDLPLATDRITTMSAADRLCRSLLIEVPATLTQRIDLLDDLIAGQGAARAVGDARHLGPTAFGKRWKGVASDWLALRGVVEWIRANPDLRLLVSRIEDPAAPFAQAKSALEARDRFVKDLGDLFASLVFARSELQGGGKVEAISTERLADRLALWGESGELLSKWVEYCRCANAARSAGIDELVDRLHDGRIAPKEAMGRFEMSFYEAVFREQVRMRPELAQFDGALHTKLVQEFVDLDRNRLLASALEVVRVHHRQIPIRSGGGIGPLGVLRGEIAKKRNHLPIRQLMQRAAPAVQALKPVFMMSPLSVAQFLPPAALSFDLLVMDEASQIQPVDALGAIARARQVVVVGDPQQLPPTAFFAKLTGGDGDEDEDEETTKVGDVESILGLFSARGLPTKMLRWHYRSRHQSLIAVSNRQFYDDQLYIVPSPHSAEAGMGLRFHHIPDGVFETGKSRTNPIEARAVAEAIVRHAAEHPELSLGVAAFSAQQRRAIQDQVELLRRKLPPEIESFFQAHATEPFFVKNLENVQGDERDVIFISVGYGPSALGARPAMRFGPLGQEGGERRLNVLISRAKRRCEVFSSITDEDIDLDFARTRKGVLAFRIFLAYARTGQFTFAERMAQDHDGVFEEQVTRALRDHGYQVHPRLGIAGFFIDLAVADPEHPGRYLMGIECDGASYHQARFARERDRLRRAVLEDHGWIIHRIWSSDWLNRPNEQLRRLLTALDGAKRDLQLRPASELKRTRAIPVEVFTIDRTDVTEVGLRDAQDEVATKDDRCYVEARVEKPLGFSAELHEAPLGVLMAAVEQVVAIEGPVHVDEMVVRVREGWGLQRAGSRIRGALEGALRKLVESHRVVRVQNFLSVPDQAVRVRDRGDVASTSLRKPEMLPPAELRVAVLDVVRANFGATPDQVVQAVSRAVGIRSTSGQVRGVIEQVVDGMVGKGELVERDGVLTAG